MKTNYVHVASMLLCVGAVSACDGLVDKLAQKSADASVAAAQAGMSDDEKLAEKLGNYVGCINTTSESATRSASYYYHDVDKDAGPTGDGSNVRGLLTLTNPDYCIDGIKKANEQDPDDPEIEGIADRYVKALTDLRPILDEAVKYYDEDDYKDDGLAKGKEMHPKLVAAFDAFFAVNDEFHKAYAARGDALAVRELERVEKEEGRRMLFHVKNVMAQAKALVEAGDAEDWQKVDEAAFSAAADVYEKAAEEAEAYSKAHPKEKGSITMYSRFDSGMADLRKQAKELRRRIRDKKALTESELRSQASFPVDGTVAKLIETYNDLVESSNSLSWNRYEPE